MIFQFIYLVMIFNDDVSTDATDRIGILAGIGKFEDSKKLINTDDDFLV